MSPQPLSDAELRAILEQRDAALARVRALRTALVVELVEYVRRSDLDAALAAPPAPEPPR